MARIEFLSEPFARDILAGESNIWKILEMLEFCVAILGICDTVASEESQRGSEVGCGKGKDDGRQSKTRSSRV